MFKIGEIVVCINAKKRWYRLGGLELNEMYTITGFNPYDGGLILKEVKSPRSGFNAYATNRFRKVDQNFANKVIAEIIPQPNPVLKEKEFDLTLLN
jgi:hypothetical protein